MDTQELTNRLRDPAEFEALVAPNNRMRNVGFGLLGFGVALIVLRAVMTALEISGEGLPWRLYWGMFFNATWEGGRTALLMNLAFILGIPLIIAGVIVTIIAFATAGSRFRSAHQRYLAGGFATRAEETGFAHQVNKVTTPLVVLSHPSQSEQDFQGLVAHLRQRVAAADKPLMTRLSQVTQASAHSGHPVAQVFTEAQVPNVLTQARPTGTAVVLPHSDPTKAPGVLSLKKPK